MNLMGPCRLVEFVGVLGLALLTHSSVAQADLVVTIPPPLTLDEGHPGFDTFDVTNVGIGNIVIRGVTAAGPNVGGDPGDELIGVVPVDDHVDDTLAPGQTIHIEYQLFTPKPDVGEPNDVGINALIFAIRGENPLTGKFETGNGTAVVLVRDTPEPSALTIAGTGSVAVAVFSRLWRRRRLDHR
jgi:hypothetical protein